MGYNYKTFTWERGMKDCLDIYEFKWQKFSVINKPDIRMGKEGVRGMRVQGHHESRAESTLYDQSWCTPSPESGVFGMHLFQHHLAYAEAPNRDRT